LPTKLVVDPAVPTAPRLATLDARRAAGLVALVLAGHAALGWAAVRAAVPDRPTAGARPAHEASGVAVVLIGLHPTPIESSSAATPKPLDPAPVRVAPNGGPAAPPRAPRPASPASGDAAAAPAAPTPSAMPVAPPRAPRPGSPSTGDSVVAPAAPTTPSMPAGAPSEVPSVSTDGGPVAATLASAMPSRGAGIPVPAPEPGPPGAPEVPVYPTRIPPPALLTYDLRRGVFSGTGALSWRPEGDRYSARLEGRIAGLTVLEWSSEGRFDRAGLAPDRYVDRRRTGSRQAANFQREAGKVSYSGPSIEHPLVPGAQDRLSWMLQLAAIARARPAAIAEAATVSMWVSGARGDGDVWTFRSKGVQPLELAGGPVTTVKLQRLPREPYDTRVEVWLDPARGYLPVRARLTSGREDDVLDLVLRP
jgi:hypothetical protein